jgi:hypothetical protein
MTDYLTIPIPIVTTLILVAILVIIGTILTSRKLLTKIIGNLKWLAAVVLLAGFVIYFIGYWFYYDKELNIVALTFRSLLSSIGMFALQSDLQYFVYDGVKESSLFLGIFAIIHFLAALVSAIFIINFEGLKIVSWLKLRNAKGQDLYVFWGMNQNSITLAEDKTFKEKVLADGGMLIFVGTLQDAAQGNQQFSFSTLINGQRLRKDRIRRIEENKDAIITYCADELSVEENSKRPHNIFKSAALKSLAGIITKSKDKHIRIFFLSDDEKKNVELTSLLLKAIEKEDEALSNCQHLNIYCLARRNKENSVLEKLAYVKSDETLPNVYLIDSANLAIQVLKKNVNYQPVSFVDINTDKAIAVTPFEALVIGFDSTGRDAVRFLYEFGALPDSNGNKSSFKCYAIDKQMEELIGTFYNNVPTVKNSNELELLQMDVQSEQFWKWIDERILCLNYIVIALGDDKLGMQLAIDLLEKAYKINMEMKYFKLFLRSYSKENEGILEDIIRFYNEKVGNKLVLFGTNSELYTYTNVIDEEALEHAKMFYTKYVSNDKQEKCSPTWNQRHEINVKIDNGNGVCHYVKKNIEEITLDDINGVIRKENQDIANYHHMDTKLRLVGLSRSSTNEDFDKLNDTQKKNLAICEHLRWNASHEMLGYVYGDETSDMKKTHKYLKPWEDLPDYIQYYDELVWTTTRDITISSYENK